MQRGRADSQGRGPQQVSRLKVCSSGSEADSELSGALSPGPTHCPSVPFSLGSAARVLGSGQTEVGSQP